MLVETAETELIRRAGGGDMVAFEDLLRPLVAPACRLAYTLLSDWGEAEDVVQESAFKAWRGIGRLRGDTARLRPWFLTIVANQARSVRRRRAFSTITVADLSGALPAEDRTPDAAPVPVGLWLIDPASGQARQLEKAGNWVGVGGGRPGS